MTKKTVSYQLRRYLLRSSLQIIMPLTFGGWIWSYLISEDIYLSLFAALIFMMFASMHVLANRIDKILFFFTGNRLSFLTIQIGKMVVEVLAAFMLICCYLYYKEGYIVFTHGDMQKFLIILYIASTLGLIVSLVTLLQRMVGHAVLMKYLRGKYHTPREEEYIFMFLDLKDSTTIAESIGHIKFFSLINELMHDVMEPVIDNRGDIYKYVGDEVIITWPKQKGLKNNRCLKLFFDIAKRIDAEEPKYQKQYGVIPQFKAGIHVGKVVVGEMGSFRSEIAYMGDAVNTTARIQAECKSHNANVLISRQLFDMTYKTQGFRFEVLNKLRLKGKLSDMILVKVEQSD